MRLLLISEVAIVEHVFTLICKRLNIVLEVQQKSVVNGEFDFIVLDQAYIDDNFNSYKQYTKKLGAITSEELSFSKSRDFIIPRPFLPNQLENILKEQVEHLKDEELRNKRASYVQNSEEDESFLVSYEEIKKEQELLRGNLKKESPFVNIDKIDFNEYEIEDEDESLVSINNSKNGGILDTNELTKINGILREERIQNEINTDRNDWKDINLIIDEALDEVREYEFEIQKTTEEAYNLILNKYSIEELKPFLEKFNQDIINKLVSGQTVDVRISLKDKKDGK